MNISRKNISLWLFAALCAAQTLLNADKGRFASAVRHGPARGTVVAAEPFTANETNLGYVRVGVGYDETNDFAMPANATVHGNWSQYGTRTGFFPDGAGNIVNADGWLILPDGTAADVFHAPLAVAGEFQRTGTDLPESFFWRAETAESTFYTWRNLFYRCDGRYPCSFQAEICKRSGDIVFRHAFPQTVSAEDCSIGLRTCARGGIPPACYASDAVEVSPSLTSVRWASIAGLSDGTGDTDGDGISDASEIRIYGTDPRSADGDRDGLDDASEIAAGTNPFAPDSDGDGLADSIDPAPLAGGGSCHGQSAAWTDAAFGTNSPQAQIGYAAWIANEIGSNATNGLYMFSIGVQTVPPKPVLLCVEDCPPVIADAAGECRYLLKKGKRYGIFCEPPADVSFSVADDIDGRAVTGEVRIGIPGGDGIGYVEVVPEIAIVPDREPPRIGEIRHYSVEGDLPEDANVSYEWIAATGSEQIDFPSSNSTDIARSGDLFCVTQIVRFWDRAVTNRIGHVAVARAGGTGEGGDALSLAMQDTVFANNDDDDGDETEDAVQNGAVPGENDLVPLYISYSLPEIGNVSLAISRGGMKIYAKNDKSQELSDLAIADMFRGVDSTNAVLYLEGGTADTAYMSRSISASLGYLHTGDLRFTVADVSAEPVNNGWKEDGGTNFVLNPCTIVQGGKAWFSVDVEPPDYPEERIVWSISPEGAASFVTTNRGSAVAVTGVSAGAHVELSVQIGPLTNAVPVFSAEVVTNVTVKLYPMVIESDEEESKYTPFTDSEIYSMVDRANDIYRQIGMSFEIDGAIARTNIDSMCTVLYDKWGNKQGPQKLRSGMNGLEVYFVNRISTTNNASKCLYGFCSAYGIIVARNCFLETLSHEIGHAFGWPDIHTHTPSGVQSIEGSVSRQREPFDWSAGTGTRFYMPGLRQDDLIARCIMKSPAEENRADIPAGSIYGILETRTGVNTYRYTQEDVAIGRSILWKLGENFERLKSK